MTLRRKALRRARLVLAAPAALAAFAAMIVAGSSRADDSLVVAVRRDLPGALGSIAPARVPIAGHDVVVRAGAERVRVVVDGKIAGASARVPARARVEIEGTVPGRAELVVDGRPLAVAVIEARFFDGDGRLVDPATSHASLQRTPPERVADDPFADTHDPDALRVVIVAARDDLPGTVTIASLAASGAVIDRLAGVPLGEVPCLAGAPEGSVCGSTRAIRAVADDIDRRHPTVVDRSIKAELGGALVVGTDRGDPLQGIRVGGPRRSDLGPIDRYRARLRVVMVCARPGGPPPMGGDDAGALRLVREEVRRANGLWGACGVSFGPPDALDVRIVDPPPPHLIAIGCDHGLPASGGQLRVRVDGRDVSVPVPAGTPPAAAARLLASAVGGAGFVARVSDNPRIGAGALPTADVLVRRPGGGLAAIEPPRAGPVSTDGTMTACLGVVDLEDGLQHFGDVDAIAGTVEERALLKAFDDGDPTTIEVVMVASFGGGGRIGESFISADGGALQNVVLLDRAAIRADRASFALAHEIGHVLLDDPGHPDDFGVDTPTRLMDADAASGTAYGPRRLLVGECVRAIRQSGPGAPAPLLARWPLAPIGAEPPPALGRAIARSRR